MTDGEGREAKAESSTTDAKEGTGAPAPRGASRTGIVLGGLAGLLILAGAYYFVGHRAGTEVATEARSERPADSPTIAQTQRPPDGLAKSAPPTTPSQEQPAAPAQSPPPSVPQQAASAVPPAPTPPAETPATPPATSTAPPATAAAPPAAPATPPAAIAQDSTTSPRASEGERPLDSAKATPGTPPAGATEAASTAQPSMRDQPAALPDQAAAAPKKENVLVVMRGPANIRSAPGKKGRVIGTAPRDATVKELDRSGNWVQVETDAGTGWINAALLGSPESR